MGVFTAWSGAEDALAGVSVNASSFLLPYFFFARAARLALALAALAALTAFLLFLPLIKSSNFSLSSLRAIPRLSCSERDC